MKKKIWILIISIIVVGFIVVLVNTFSKENNKNIAEEGSNYNTLSSNSENSKTSIDSNTNDYSSSSNSDIGSSKTSSLGTNSSSTSSSNISNTTNNSNTSESSQSTNNSTSNQNALTGIIANSDGGNVGIYEYASSKTTLLTALAPDTKVTVLEQNGDFYKIKVNNIIGYVPVRYLNLNENNNKLDTSVSGTAQISNSDGGNVGIYKYINDKSSFITALEPGTSVTVLGREDNFYKIKFGNNEEGYVLSMFVSFSSSNKIQRAIVGNCTSQVTVYSKASESAESLGTITKGTELAIIKNDGSWYEIDYNNKTGYIPSKYVVFE